MDQQRRLLTFTVLSFLILFGWMSVGPKLFPGMFPPPQKPVKKQDPQKDDAVPADQVAEADKPDKADKADKPEIVVDETTKLPDHPTKPIVIGSDKPETGYGLRVTLSSIGAAIVSAELNDPRYMALKPWQPGLPVSQLSLLGNDLTNKLQPLKAAPPVTGQLAIEEIDKSLRKLDREANLARLNWKIIAEDVEPVGAAQRVTKSVTFGLKTPDGVWELRKKYAVRRWDDANAKRDEDPTGYQLIVELSFSNLSSKEHTLVYDLQGPAGLPLENKENASKFRDVKFAFREKDGDLVGTNSLTSRDLVKTFDNNKIEELKAGNRTFQYVGLDTQYFTALVLPQDVARREARLAVLAEEASEAAGEKTTVADLIAGTKGVPNEQAAQARKLLAESASYLDFAKPQVVQKNAAQPGWSEVSVQLHSVEHTVPAEDEITHEYLFYLGPKRVALLTPLRADKVIDYSGFLIIPASLVATIASGLLWVLNFFHGLGIPYGFCVMLLTVLVRSCMFPISKKQALNAKRMKEVQPRIAELKAKHADDKQKFAEEQMKLFAETGFNPLSGCLPVLLQLPIFIGLYQSLSTSVDLRRAPFLWFDNLAAPDALFLLPIINLPFIGNFFQEFNLLPIITTSLFLFQQKMFMPPPTDEQTRMQAKVFFWMTLMMGFMFYHVPAGLCVYFIASSLWSMAERKLLDRVKLAPPPTAAAATNGIRPNSGPQTPVNNFWSRLRDKLADMGEMQDVNGIPASGQRRQRDKDKRKSRP